MTDEQREKRNAYRREWAKNNPEKVLAQQERYWGRKAGIAESVEVSYMLDEGAYPPEKAYPDDAGYDLRAAKDALIYSSGTVIETGVHINIPSGYYGRITGRSGLNFNSGIICPEGTVDAGYTGAVKVKLYSMNGTKLIAAGDKVAQLIILKLPAVVLDQVQELPETARAENGFGSTGR